MDAVELARAFGFEGPARISDAPVSGGRQGAIWRLEAGGGTWAAKVPFEPRTEADVGPATRFHEAAHTAGVPCPQVRRTPSGAVLASVGGCQVRLHEWVDVRPPDPMLDPELVGSVVAHLHRLDVPDTRPSGAWHTQPVGVVQWDELVAALARTGAPFATQLAQLRDELVALETWIELPRRRQMCHRDLWADNVRATSGAGACVLDWDDAGAADPSHELACVLFEFGRTDPGRARALTQAYAAAGGPGAVTRRADFSMLVAQLGHITYSAAQDWLRPGASPPQRAQSQALVREALDDLHSRVVLDALLAAVRGD